MDKDYSEIFCNAVDTIVQKRLENMHFDITKVCRIKANKGNGQYLVSNDAATFYAYGPLGFEVGEEVYVLIPCGDYAINSLILGRYKALTSIEGASLENKYQHKMVIIPTDNVWVKKDSQSYKMPQKISNTEYQILVEGYTSIDAPIDLKINNTIYRNINPYNQATTFITPERKLPDNNSQIGAVKIELPTNLYKNSFRVNKIVVYYEKKEGETNDSIST